MNNANPQVKSRLQIMRGKRETFSFRPTKKKQQKQANAITVEIRYCLSRNQHALTSKLFTDEEKKEAMRSISCVRDIYTRYAPVLSLDIALYLKIDSTSSRCNLITGDPFPRMTRRAPRFIGFFPREALLARFAASFLLWRASPASPAPTC